MTADTGPTYDSPGFTPEKGDFRTRAEFLEVYPEWEHLADIYFDDEGSDPHGVTG